MMSALTKARSSALGGMFYRFKEMADQRGSERGSVDAWNLIKAKLFTTLPNPRFITENNDIATRAEGPTAKGVTLDGWQLSLEGLTGSEKG